MNTHQLAYASFSISGDNLDPEFWTQHLGVTPYIAHRKGELFTTSRGQLLKKRVGVWAVSSKSAVQSDNLEPHLRYLIGHLALPRSDLRELVERMDGRMRFFCYWANYSGDRVPDVPADIRTMMESMGGIIDIDEYR